jgi:hypothetical protein
MARSGRPGNVHAAIGIGMNMSLQRICDHCNNWIKDTASSSGEGGDRYFYSVSRYYVDMNKGSAGTKDYHDSCIDAVYFETRSIK